MAALAQTAVWRKLLMKKSRNETWDRVRLLKTYLITRSFSTLDKGISGVCLFILILCSVALQLISSDLLLRNRGIAWGEAKASAFATDEEMLGINAALEDEPDDRLDRGVSLMADGGYRWVRQAFPWKDIEPTRGTYNWQKWDRLVSAYSNAGLRVIARLDQPPHWSRQDNNWANRPPDNLDDYANFVGAFVTRYKGTVNHIQIWDEPNIFPNWGNRAVDPAGYVELLRTAHNSAKAVNPNVKVLTAGFAPNSENGGRNMADTLFLEAMYRHGARPYFDVLATKPYGLWNPPDDRRVGDQVLNFSRVVRLREIMEAYGDGSKSMWAVEFGWNSLPESWKGEPSPWGYVSEQTQAAYATTAVQRARVEWPWLQVMLLQGFGPQHAPSNPLHGFSVVDEYYSPRPVYHAVRDATKQTFARPGRHLVDARYVYLDGSWRWFGKGTVGMAGDILSLPFYGTRIDATIWQSPTAGTVQVAVDGKTDSLSPLLDSAGRIDLRSSTARRAAVTLASGLEDRQHVLQLRVVPSIDSGLKKSGEVMIEEFIVIREAPFSVNEALIAVLLALQAGATLALLSLLRNRCRSIWMAASSAARVGLDVMLEAILSSAKRFAQAASGGGSEWTILVMALGLAAFYFISFMPVALAGLLLYALLAWMQPGVGLLFVVFAAPFHLLPKQFGSLQFSMVEILIVTSCGLFLLRIATDAFAGRRSFPWPPVAGVSECARSLISANRNLPIVLLLVASLLSLLVAERLHEGLREFRTVILEPVVYYWLLVRLVSRREVRWLADALLVSAVLISIVALYQYIFDVNLITAEGVLRVRSFYGSPNNLGLFLGRVLPLAICLGWFGGWNFRLRAWYLGSACLVAVAIVLTFSAGAWLGVAAALLVIIGFKSVRLVSVAGATAVGLAVVLPQILPQQRIASRFDLEQGTAALRLMIWQASAKMIQDHPLLGVGLDNFLNQYPRYMLAAAWREPNLSHPHNIVLDYWLRTGLLGLVAGLWLIVRFFVSGVRLYWREADPRIKALALGLLGSMTDFVIHGMIDNSYFTVDLAIIFWTSIAAVKILEGEKGLG